MIPESIVSEEIIEVEEYEPLPSTTYRLDFENKRIIGKIDEKDAVLQFIKKVLNTDKYAYPIYNWYYGNQILSLIGKPYDYVVADCPRIVEEALTVDDRILSVTDFNFSRITVDSLEMSCNVNTIYGIINYTQEVSI